MGDISKNFNRSELACKCGCGMDTVDTELIAILQSIRDEFGPVIVTSANRCDSYNKEKGGVDDSWHTKSRAADIVVRGVSPKAIGAFVDKEHPNTGLGVYDDFVHVDSRGYKARW